MIVKPLDLKMLRDLRLMRGPAIAIALVLAGGVAVFVMMSGTHVSLEASRSAFYEQQAFAHVFAGAKRYPRTLHHRIASIDGTLAAQSRITGQALVKAEEESQYATARAISLPPHGLVATVSKPRLIRGRMPRTDSEVLVNEAFFDARSMSLGDELEAIVGGRSLQLIVVGAAISPEFVLVMPPGGIVPDNARHGVVWMAHATLAAALDYEGSYNEVALALRRNANVGHVLDQLDLILAPYGGTGAYTRAEQESHLILQSEIDQQRNFASVIPALFLAVAAFLLYLALGRAVAADRGRIGLLKALGYTNAAVGMHYAKIALIVTLPGVALGVALGYWLGTLQMLAYLAFFNLPGLEFRLIASTCIAAAAWSIAIALVGSSGSVIGAVRLGPAAAMAPPPPPSFRASLAERLLPLERLSSSARCVARNLLRWPLRALTTTAGLALAGGLMMFGFYINDAFDLIQRAYFEGAERQHATVTFTDSAPPSILQELRGEPGVLAVEPALIVPVRLVHGLHEVRRPIFGMSTEANMRQPIDENFNPVKFAPKGIIVARGLARKMEVGIGDVLQVEFLSGKRNVKPVEITGISDELIGTGAFMNMDALVDLMDDAPHLTGAMLLTDASYEDRLRRELPALPNVAALVFQADAQESFNNTVAAGMLFSAVITIGLSALIIAGVAYNCVRVSLDFRLRELATLRVLGYRSGEVARVLFGEIAFIGLCALPLCAWLGWLMVTAIAVTASNDIYQMPVAITPRSYTFNLLTLAATIALATIPAKKALDRLDLANAVKSRE